MMTRKKIAVGLAALGLLAAAAPSYAIPSLTYDPTNYGIVNVDPFTAFDWNSAGAAVTSGFTPDGSTVFTTEYWADAIGIKSGASTVAGSLTAAGVANGAEFTINAIILETATLSVDGNTSFFTATGGTWVIYYEALSDANLVTGAGITDGAIVMSGTILPGYAGSFTNIPATGGTGIFTFNATVDYTNPAFINPSLASTLAVSTIQFGTSRTDGSDPTSVPGAAGGTDALPTGDNVFLFQADANQSFAIPVPGTLALMSLGLLGLTGLGRRLRRS